MPQKNKIPKINIPAPILEKQILTFFKQNPKKFIGANLLIRSLNLSCSKESVHSVLASLKKKSLIHKASDGKFTFEKFSPPSPRLENAALQIGVVDMTQHGGAFIVVDGVTKDIYVPSIYMNGAMNGDKVKVKLNSKLKRRPEGQIVEIVERAAEVFIGVLHIKKHYGVVELVNNPLSSIIVYPSDFNGAKDGFTVVVKILEWPTKKQIKAIGTITTSLGKVGESEFAMNEILIKQGFDISFDPAVIAESEKISGEITQAEVNVRRDCRDITTFTIDPATAKDFDDALSIQYLDNEEIEIGVHIADVTHFVKADTLLDRDAYRRSTSVYLVDRVCPMLPERLSNELCSLRPNEDKYCFSAMFIFSKDGKIKNTWLGKTIIHSDHRFTYEGAQEVLEGIAPGPFAKELTELNNIARILRKEKFQNGAINFDSEEVQFELDAEGRPIGIFIKERKEAHLLIEDFMLLANREVARFIATKEQLEIPMIYRVHDLPDQDKLENLALFAGQLGIKLDFQSPQKIAQSLDYLIKKAQDDERLKLLEPLAIKCMAKAEYSSNNIGHYGLAFKYYSHFTSPIRRYSDVLCHRILFDNLKTTIRHNKEALERQCKHISKQERKAMDAKRQSIKYKQVEYLQNHVGESFEGLVSGLTDRGIFVELIANKCEGFVPFEHMDQYYTLDATKLKAQSNKGNSVIQIGDACKVQVKSTNLTKRQIELTLIN